jgi:hypothetical protein
MGGGRTSFFFGRWVDGGPRTRYGKRKVVMEVKPNLEG